MNRQTLLACLLYLIVGLTGSGVAAAKAGSGCPPESYWAGILGLGAEEVARDRWLLACDTAPDGSVLLAGLLLPKEPEEPKAPAGQATLLVSQYVGVKKPPPDRFKLEAKLFERWEEPQLSIAADKLGEVPILRVSYRTATGEDYYSASETLTLLARTDGGLVHVWTGAGGGMSRSMDLCYVRRSASFSLNADGSLQRTVRSEYSINKANYRSDLPVLRTILKECRGPRTTSTRIPLEVRLR